MIFIVKKAIDISQEKADDYITVIDGTIRNLKTKADDYIAVIDGTVRDLKTKADDYVAVIDGTVRDLESTVDAIYATYQAGDFYSKAESDSRFYSKAQTDDKDAATLASAQSYTDAQLKTVVKYATGDHLSTGSEVSINDLKTNGNYPFGGTLNWVGVPKDLAGQQRWGQLEVFNAADITFQKIYTNENEFYFRQCSGHPLIWLPWRKVQMIEVG